MTVDIDDQSGLLVEVRERKPSSVDNPANRPVVVVNDADDDSVLHVEWFAGGGCAPSYLMRIGPTARTIRIEGPPAGSDSIGGNCDVTLRFSEPVPAEEVVGELVDR